MKEKTRKTTITPKEKKIIELIALGYTDREIAAHLNSTYSSIRSIFGNLLIKTGTVNRPHLVSWAYKEKMFDNSEFRVALTDIRTGERDIRVEQDKRLTKENNCYRKALEPFNDEYFKGLDTKQIAELAKKSIRLTTENRKLENALDEIKEYCLKAKDPCQDDWNRETENFAKPIHDIIIKSKGANNAN